MVVNNKYFRGTILLLLIVSSVVATWIRFKSDPIVNEVILKEGGKDLNILRDSLNIPPIEDQWILHELDSSYAFWANRNKGVTKPEPYHLNKVVRYDKGLPALEEDEFHYESLDSIAFRLVCKFSYIENDVIYYRFITYFKGKYPPTEGKQVDHHFADSIFNAWGLKNYYDISIGESL